jgi:hypothetical protein
MAFRIRNFKSVDMRTCGTKRRACWNEFDQETKQVHLLHAGLEDLRKRRREALREIKIRKEARQRAQKDLEFIEADEQIEWAVAEVMGSDREVEPMKEVARQMEGTQTSLEILE